ncbi:peptide/nickel transport system permease protein [Rhodopseudomonas julia]|uniref:Peptide/nickel transport system permease protein n=1 Tax=Rhodopseudomonas julia TaxID=200617 RepID=A0ABU0CAP9_9BRAD|nr:ABC transporter permease [Rhodopseudomonas julia]MDQ0327586.1 peptide/nickel transport system permease protein [Rhodopseudomonas julia]
MVEATSTAIDGDAVATDVAAAGKARAKRGIRFRYARYVVRRLLQAVPIIVVIVLINFTLIQAAPGDPVYALIGQMETTPEYIAQVREEFGLDEPLPQQFLSYIAKIATFDLGYSFRFRQDVSGLIFERVPATFLLMGTALVISSILGIGLGVIAGRRPFGWTDNAATIFALAGFSIPVFWLGQLVLLVFALKLPWFPVQGMVSLRAPSHGWGYIASVLHHLVLPATVYGIYHLTLIFRMTRIKMMDVLVQDFITTARSKGAGERRVLFVHALPNAILPVITVIGYNFGFMLAGSVLVETVFGWPGLGRLMYEAINARDYPLLLGLFVVISLFVIIANVLTDIIYALIDPRILYR